MTITFPQISYISFFFNAVIFLSVVCAADVAVVVYVVLGGGASLNGASRFIRKV